MKKNIIFTLFFGFMLTAGSFAQSINWVTLDKALELQKKAPKKIIMDVYTTWCGPCKMLDQNTFHNADVVKYVNANYYAVKFDAEGNQKVTYKGQAYANTNYKEALKNSRNGVHQFTSALRISAYPTIVYFDEKGEVIAPIPGYQTPSQLELYLKLFHNNDYKNITSNEAFKSYYEAFKPTFKN